MSTSSHIPTSFVPLPPQPAYKRHWRLDFSGALGFVAFGIFVLVSIVAVGMFLYQMYLQRNLGLVEKKVQTAEHYLNATTIQKMTNLNNRFIAAQELFGTHVTMSRFLDVLSMDTPKDVRLASLGIAMDPKGGTASIKTTGEARDFNALVIESRLLEENKDLSNIVFSNIAIDSKTNGVKFSFSATASKNLIENFSAVVSGVSTATSAQANATSTMKTSTTTKS